MLWTTGTPLSLTWTEMSPDEIEQCIIRAYIQLAYTPETYGSRTVTVVRLGLLEARLTEVSEEQRLPGMPWFWLELYSHERGAAVESCGCTEFDEDNLARAVEFIANARQQAESLH
ncbi:hypothetical protein JKG68_29305 [Microvirga aerilata]|uniref:Uncharacterized protein n=1 Tax=Microvirga aerilata TaxID=670292 RepID=A0A937D4W9_9HYPH|nr:hypothetical protein [Microvirga aerilata]MBL0408000.1 hypothetical protein [Microvirga aerilata]